MRYGLAHAEGEPFGTHLRLSTEAESTKWTHFARWHQFTGEELQVKFSGGFSLSETNGRLVGTRTPDLYRVKGQLTNTLNNLESDWDRLSTPKYV